MAFINICLEVLIGTIVFSVYCIVVSASIREIKNSGEKIKMENKCEVKESALKVETLISKSEWIALCKKYGKWCSFDTVKNHTYAETEDFIKSMSCWTPMQEGIQ